MTPQNSTPKKERFLKAFTKCGNISLAAEIASVDRTSHYFWMKDESYRTRFEESKEVAVECLELEARHRAVEGVERLKFYKGEPIYHTNENGERELYIEKQYSDTLLIFLLKCLKPEKYRDVAKPRCNGKAKNTGEVQRTADSIVRELKESDWYVDSHRQNEIETSRV